MKSLLKYLIVIIVAAAFWNRADGFVRTDSNEKAAVHHINEIQADSSISASESEFCPPRQASFANTTRVQSTARRTNCVHRNSLEFIKCGKIINAGQRYFIQRKSTIGHSSLTEPAHKLLALGKLII